MANIGIEVLVREPGLDIALVDAADCRDVAVESRRPHDDVGVAVLRISARAIIARGCSSCSGHAARLALLWSAFVPAAAVRGPCRRGHEVVVACVVVGRRRCRRARLIRVC